MTSLRISAALAIFAVAAVVAGVVLLTGVAWGLITVGAFGLGGAFLLYEPAGKRDR